MRHFLINEEAVEDGVITIDGADARHIKNVLRLAVGDEILITVIGESRYHCAIESVTAKSASARIVDELELPPPLHPAITAYICLLKSQKFDDVVRVLAELGVSKIVPVISDRCVAKLSDSNKKLERWQAIALSAAKQSKGSSIMEIGEPVQIGDIEGDSDLNILLWEEETSTSLRSILEEAPDIDSISILTGPEGGLTVEETSLLRAKNFKVATLGQRILRAETAPVVAISAIAYHYGK